MDIQRKERYHKGRYEKLVRGEKENAEIWNFKKWGRGTSLFLEKSKWNGNQSVGFRSNFGESFDSGEGGASSRCSGGL